MAMDETQDKQKDLKQLVDVASILFDRNQEVQNKCDDQNNTLNMTMQELQRVSEELMQVQVSKLG